MREAYADQTGKETHHVAFEVGEDAGVAVMIHRLPVRQGDVAATHRQPVVGRQPEIVHEVARILDALPVLPTRCGQLLWCERIGDHHVSEHGALLCGRLGNQMRVRIRGEDDLVRALTPPGV